MTAPSAAQHLVATHQVAVRGGRATCLHDGQDTHYLPSRTGQRLWATAGRYTVALARASQAPAGWQVTALVPAAPSGRGNQALTAAAAARVAGAGAPSGAGSA